MGRVCWPPILRWLISVIEHDADVQMFGSAARPYADVRAELEVALVLRAEELSR